jgi:group I intron endonuclease
MNIYSIYRVTNITNNKVYIGFTSNYASRIKTHRAKYKRENSRFYSALVHYGWDNFAWDIIYQSTEYEHCKNVMEHHFISEYASYYLCENTNGYNMTQGGDGGPTKLNICLSQTHKQKIGDANRGKTHTPEFKAECAKRQTGTHLSSTTKAKISAGNKNKMVSNETKEKPRLRMIEVWAKRRLANSIN